MPGFRSVVRGVNVRCEGPLIGVAVPETPGEINVKKQIEIKHSTYRGAHTKPDNIHNPTQVTIFVCVVRIHFVEFCIYFSASRQALELLYNSQYLFWSHDRYFLPKNVSEGAGLIFGNSPGSEEVTIFECVMLVHFVAFCKKLNFYPVAKRLNSSTACTSYFGHMTAPSYRKKGFEKCRVLYVQIFKARRKLVVVVLNIVKIFENSENRGSRSQFGLFWVISECENFTICTIMMGPVGIDIRSSLITGCVDEKICETSSES